MKAPQFLVSTVATAAVVSAIGFAYAQTSTSPDDSTNTPKAVDQTPAPSGNMNSGSTPSESSTTATEPAARSDRN